MALCLSRKEGESILIGDSVQVTVTRVRGNHVSLLIEANKEIPIIRAGAKNEPKLPKLGEEQRSVFRKPEPTPLKGQLVITLQDDQMDDFTIDSLNPIDHEQTK